MTPAATLLSCLVTKHDQRVAAPPYQGDTPDTQGSPSRQATNPNCSTGGHIAELEARIPSLP
jgi:hypothetical protein